jgi:hypothetical protein
MENKTTLARLRLTTAPARGTRSTGELIGAEENAGTRRSSIHVERLAVEDQLFAVLPPSERVSNIGFALDRMEADSQRILFAMSRRDRDIFLARLRAADPDDGLIRAFRRFELRRQVRLLERMRQSERSE